MFAKVLVANRGEIAIRAFRAAYEVGAATVAVFPWEDRWSEHRLKADEAYEIGERGHPVRAYLDPEAIVAAALRAGADAVYPGYGFLSENPALAEACAARRHHLRRPERRGAHADRQQGPRHRGGPGGRRADPGRRRPLDRRRRPGRRPRRRCRSRCSSRPSPAAAAAGCGASTTRAGCGRRSRRACARPRARSATRPCSSSRPWSTRATSRCRSSPTPPVEVIHLFERDCSVQRRHQKVVEIAPAPRPRPRPARADLRRRGALRPRDRLRQRRHRRVPARPRRPLRLHRDEPADPGRAHGHRGDHRRRPGAVADADRGRRDPGRPRASTQDAITRARRGAAVPDHHRGPGQRVPPRHRQDHHVPLAGRRRRPAGRRHDVHRRGGQRALRLDAGQADLPRPHVRQGGREGAPGARRVPHPRRRHQHPVPAGGAGRPRLRRRRGHHRVHRGPPAAADRPLARRPRHPADPVPRRRHRQPAARRRAGDASTRPPSSRRSTGRAGPPDGSRQRLLRARPGGLRGRRCAPRPASRSPTPRSATPTSPCWPPGCAPGTCCTVAGHVARTTPQLWSLECWGGATYDVALRFLSEDPWERLAALREEVPNICLQMLLRGRNTVGYTPYPDRGHRRLRRGGGRHRHRRLPDLRRAQRRRADAAGDRGRAGDRHRPSPRSRCATPATCPTPASGSTRWTTTCGWPSGSSRPAPTSSRSRTWPGCCAVPGRADPGDGAARALRPAGPPAHPRHPGRAARHPARRDRRRGRRRRRGHRLDGRDHLPAGAVGAGRGHRPRRARDRARPRRRVRAGAVLGGDPRGSTRRSSPACPRPPAGSTPTRSPAASCPTCASRRSRWGWARSSSRSRTCTPPRTRSSATSSR